MQQASQVPFFGTDHGIRLSMAALRQLFKDTEVLDCKET
jgi:hypothetical protein